MIEKASGLTIRPWVLSLVAVVVTAVWALNILAGLFVDSWEADSGVNAVMGAFLALIGAVGGKAIFTRPSNGVPPKETDNDDN